MNSDRPGKSRPMPAAPFDDPSIPVLTERLTLPDLDLDISLPPPPEPAAPTLPPPSSPPPPVVARYDREFDSDTWLVETRPLPPAPATVDISALDLTPPVLPTSPAPVAVETSTGAAEPAAVPTIHGDAAFAAPNTAPFATADVVIPASLMRVAAPSSEPTVEAEGGQSSPAPAASSVEAAPTFDRLPPVPAVDELPAQFAATLPTLETSAVPEGAAFAVPPAPAAGSHWTTLELELRESILQQLSQRLPEDVESILRRRLAPAIDAAVTASVTAASARLAAELRQAVGESLRELVDHAVQTELARLREERSR